VSGENWQMWAGASMSFFAYVILTNPTGKEILGYEFAYRISVSPGMEHLFFRLGMDFPAFVPIDITLPYYEIFADDVALGQFAPAPMPGSPAVVLLTWLFMLLSPALEVELFLGPTSGDGVTDGRLAYDTEAGPVTMNVSTGNPEFPVATVNHECILPVTETTFGSLKALFR
jgi:hypothetical protein